MRGGMKDCRVLTARNKNLAHKISLIKVVGWVNSKAEQDFL